MAENHHSPRPFDLDPFDAEEALLTGDLLTLAVFFTETSVTLRRLSDTVQLIDHGGKAATSSASGDIDKSTEEEWTGSTSQMADAISVRNADLVSSYLTRLSEIIGRVGKLFDSDRDLNEPLIVRELQQRKRGRPKKDRLKEMTENASTHMELRFAANKGVKQEATIQEIVDQGGPSRATTLRRNARRKK